MILQKTWDKYEVALLIECYENIKNGEDQKSALMQLSKDLRNMAILAGKKLMRRIAITMVWCGNMPTLSLRSIKEVMAREDPHHCL